jgi:hypothetical protein
VWKSSERRVSKQVLIDSVIFGGKDGQWECRGDVGSQVSQGGSKKFATWRKSKVRAGDERVW